MDLYIPRKRYIFVFLQLHMLILIRWTHEILHTYFLLYCSSATNRLITAKDHASVQLNVGHLDEAGRYTGQFSTFALCGYIRAQVPLLTFSCIFSRIRGVYCCFFTHFCFLFLFYSIWMNQMKSCSKLFSYLTLLVLL